MPAVIVAIVLSFLAACGFDAGRSVQAQGQLTGGGLSQVHTTGLCTGKGTANTPVNCTVQTDGTSMTGTAVVSDPLSIQDKIDEIDFGQVGDGSDGDMVYSTTYPTLIKTGATGAFDGGLVSSQTFAGDGYIQATVAEIATYKFIGLSYVNSNQSYTDLDYGLYLYEMGVAVAYENGTLIRYVGSYHSGSVVKLERVGTTVRFYIDGVNVFTSATASSGALMFDNSFYTQFSELRDARMFDNGSEVLPITWTSKVGADTRQALSSPEVGLWHDQFFDDLTVDTGFILHTFGHRLFVRGTLTLNGTIAHYGYPGTAGANGSNAVAACATAVGGAARTAATVGSASNAGADGKLTPTASANSTSNNICASGGNGAGGASSTTVGNPGATGTLCRGGGGGSGGGFVGTASSAGSASGTVVEKAATRGGFRELYSAARNRDNNTQQWAMGTGGGGGSCGRDTTSSTQREPGGGGGGSSGGWLYIAAGKLVLGPSAIIDVRGGAGGNGGSCGTHAGNAGGGGGGGGGNGGVITLFIGHGTEPSSSVLKYTGGTGGTAGTACAGGQNGGNGGDGATGFKVVHVGSAL